jgi:regulator of sigma E protease
MTTIISGLICLGIVVMVHELGHFFAARLFGVEVETFSIGWGPVILRKKLGSTEVRLSALPVGGYCGLKGEHAFSEALEKNMTSIPREDGAFFTAHPVKRILIAFAGPFANLVFAAFALTVVSAVGYKYQTYDNRIVLSSAYDAESVSGGSDVNPADKAGLAEGDRIVALDGVPVTNYGDLQQYVSMRPDERIEVEYERGTERMKTSIVPALDKKSGAGRIGVFAYVPLVVGSVSKGSAAESAGIKAGDVIAAVNGVPVAHYMQFASLLAGKPEQIAISIRRGEETLERTLVLVYNKDGNAESGIGWQTLAVTVKGTAFPECVAHGVAETGKTLALTVKSLALLFRGVDASEAVSGPVRITLMLGEVAKAGLTSVAELLSVICVSLFLMNLLPVPILDGGTILFAAFELVTGKPARPKTLYFVQFIGIAFILFVFIFALFGDIRYLTR